MSKTPVAKGAKKEEKQKPHILLVLIPVCLVALVIIAAVLLLLPSLRGDQSNPQKLMQKYYENLYAGDLNLLSECMPEELRERFEQVSTLGGVSSNIYITSRQEMIPEVGTDPQVEVTVTSNENAGSAKLTEVRSDFPDASVANQIDFQVKVTGSEGSTTMEGSTYVTQIKGQWYLTTYNLLLDKVS